MAERTYTLIFVPHARARFRKLHLAVSTAKTIAGLAAVATLALGGVLTHYVMLTGEVQSLRGVRETNAELRDQNRFYEANVTELEGQVAKLKRTVTKLGVMSGVENVLPDADLGGVGGVRGADSQAPGLDPSLSLEHMQRDVESLTSRSAKIEEFYKDQGVLLSSTPSIWPVRGYLSSKFGNRIDPFTGEKDFHPGIDISTPRGTKIIAPAEGVVVSVGRRGAYGKAIIIDHGYGVITRFGHMDGYNVRAGQRVRRGDVIGFVGDTGRANAPHLHYEVSVRHQTRNPIHFILDEYRSFG